VDGITVGDSSNNSIYGNNIANNGGYEGIHFTRSSNNYVYHNNFVDNVHEAYNYESMNVWDDGYPSGGNYWSNYYGVDDNGDGIGDTPYIIAENNRDNYPLVSPYKPTIRNLVTMYFPCLIFDEKEEYYPTNFFYDDENIGDNPTEYNKTWPLYSYIHTVECHWPPDNKDYLVIEYWFYYARDNGVITFKTDDKQLDFFDHNHDWESVYIFLEKTDTSYVPAWVMYFHHLNIKFPLTYEDCYSHNRWKKEFETKRDTHPIVHVSRDKHASLERTIYGYGLSMIDVYGASIPVIEECDGGRETNHNDFSTEIVSQVPIEWPGKFGELDAPWKKDRWNSPEYLLAFPPVKNSFSMIGMQEQQSKLYLHVYDNESRHVGYNNETSEVDVEIPESYYEDKGNATFIILPENITDFRIVVDATYAHESVEEYQIAIRTVRENGIVDEDSMTNTIEKGKQQVFDVKLDEFGNIIVIPEFSPLILPLFMTATLVALVLLKKRKHKKPET
jgi:parallel beta-helix repeat protein